MGASSPLLTLSEVERSFGSRKVIRKVSLEIRFGECALVLGANGAGKSTLLRLMSGLSRADGGSLSRAPGARVSYASHSLSLYPRLTVLENFSLFSAVSRREQRTPDLLERWQLEQFKNVRVSELSKGNQSRVSLACVFLQGPQILLLDEPSANLDDAGVSVLSEHILEVLRNSSDGRGGGVVLVTHDISRLSRLATRVIVLESGAIATDTGLEGSAQVLQQSIDGYRALNR